MALPAGSTPIDLINRVNSNLNDNLGNGEYMTQRAILVPRNEDVKAINEEIMTMIADPSRESREYFSVDTIADRDENLEMQYPIEFLNSIEASSLPPHHLKLAVGTPIMAIKKGARKRRQEAHALKWTVKRMSLPQRMECMHCHTGRALAPSLGL